MVWHLQRDGACDAGLALCVQVLALRVCDVFYRRTGDADTTVKARQGARFRKSLHIAPHSLQGHQKLICELLHRGRAAATDDIDQLYLTGIEVHGVGMGIQVAQL